MSDVRLVAISDEERVRIAQIKSIGQLMNDKLVVDIISSLCVKGFGREECPNIDQWAAYAVFTGVVRAINDNRYIIEKGDFAIPYREYGLDFALFRELETVAKEGKSKLDPKFLSAILKMALPRFHAGDGYCSGSYTQSYFRDVWPWLKINPVTNRSVGYVDEGWQKKCRKEFPKLPEEIQQSIRLCVPNIRSQAKIAVEIVRSRYPW